MVSYTRAPGARKLMAHSSINEIVKSDPLLMKVKTQVLYIPEKKLYFIHIPKCGGTSVRDVLILKKLQVNMPLETIETGNHSKSTEIGKLIDLKTSNFLVSVRNPIGRFMSAYNFLKDIDKRKLIHAEQGKVELSEGDRQFLTDRLDALESLGIAGFASFLKNLGKRRDFYNTWYKGEPEPNHFTWAFERQVDWIAGIPEANVKCFKIESQKIFEYLGTEYGGSKIKNYSRKAGLKLKDAIHEYFVEDFRRLGYSISDDFNNVRPLMAKREEENRAWAENGGDEHAPQWLRDFMKNIKIKNNLK